MKARTCICLIAACAAVVALVAPASASAANLFASPTGTAMDDCTNSGAPCSLERAVNTVSQSGDDITLLPGTYTTSTTIGGGGAFNRTIHGAPGARPTINFTAASGGQNGILLQAGSVIRDVVIESAAGGGGTALFVGGGTIERVSVHETGAHASGSDTRACAFNPETVMRDSVCWYSGAGGSNAVAIQAQSLFPGGTATLRNVTAIATNAPAIRVLASGNISGPAAMDLTSTNVIARGGGTAGQEDVTTIVGGAALRATAALDHSNYATESEAASGDITDPGSGTNVTAAPAFVNAGTGDFHQQATSTGTVDQGTATGLLGGDLDFEGQARNQGTAPDIGADELLVAPPVPTLTSTNPVSPANDNNPEVLGSTQVGSTVDLYANGTCAGSPVLEDQPAAELASPGLTVSVSGDATTQFSATATNGAGSSGCSTALAYIEDSIAPVTVIDSAPSGTTSDNTPMVAFHTDDVNGASFTCQVDSGAAAPCSPPATFGPLADGSHTISILATDPAGNVEASPQSVSFTVNTLQPVNPVPSPPSAPLRKKCKKGFVLKKVKGKKKCVRKKKRK